MVNDLTVCELFAGVGGFHLGLSRSGWNVVWSNQWEPGKKQQWAFECYRKHFEGSGTKCVNEDIGKIDVKDIPHATLLVGGFPCQDYSVATTKANGIEGKKGVLWWHIDRILRENAARGTPIPFVLLENVDRLVRSPTAQRGRDFGIILSCLNDLGYVAEWRVINASDYAYPQKRRRTFIFATLAKRVTEDLYSNKADVEVITKGGFFAPELPCRPISGNTSSSTCLWPDLIKMTESFAFGFQNAGYMKDGRIFTVKVVPAFSWDKSAGRGTLGSVLEKDVDERYFVPKEWIGNEQDRGTEAFKRTWRYCKGAKDEPRKHRNGHEYQYNEGAIPFPDRLNEPSRTMLTSEGNRRPNRIGHIVPVNEEEGVFRVLTPLETERLNGFDDNWTEGMPERWRYFCMGNALVVGLIEQMGRRLRTIVDDSGIRGMNTVAERDVTSSVIGPLDRAHDKGRVASLF